MKPYLHAQASARRYGGVPEDYLPLHDFMDSTKSAVPDWRHRAIFHNAFGVFIVEKVFGHNLTNSDGKLVSTRDVAEDHVTEDLGFIPTLEMFLRNMRVEPWMGGRKGAKTRHISPAMPPDKGLGPPLRPFSETFSAEELVLEMLPKGGMYFDQKPGSDTQVD